LHGREEERIAKRVDFRTCRAALEEVLGKCADDVDDGRQREHEKQPADQALVSIFPAHQLAELV